MNAARPGPVLMMRSGYNRLRDGLEPYREALLLMDDDGSLSSGPAPAGAWYGSDVWASPAATAFLECVSASPRLGWLHAGTAGLDAPVYAPFLARGVTVTTSHGYADGMADQVLASVLDHWQCGPERRRLRAEGRWQPHRFRELRGSRWLVIGFGAVGRAVAQRAAAFGARITGVRRTAGRDPFAERVITLDAVQAALSDADVVVLCAALNGETRGIAGERFFAAMKPGATLVNVGRGALVDEAALLAGLDQDKPGHAVLDVFVQEPLPATSPFWTHPKVAMTPHDSWCAAGAQAQNDRGFLENLRLFLAGQPLAEGAHPEPLS